MCKQENKVSLSSIVFYYFKYLKALQKFIRFVKKNFFLNN